MPKTVLITGSLGYIGSRLAQHLHGVGFRCLGYDTGFFHDCVLYPPADVETVRKDVRQIDRDDLKGVDVVIHLAGMSNDPFGYLSAEKVYDPTRVYALRLAKLCKDMGIRFIFPSSCSVYGVGKGGLLTEDGETNPQTPYSLNKLQVEGRPAGHKRREFLSHYSQAGNGLWTVPPHAFRCSGQHADGHGGGERQDRAQLRWEGPGGPTSTSTTWPGP